MRRVFSGVQPSGALHLGAYLGANLPWIAMQAEYEAVSSIAGLHVLTSPERVHPHHLRPTVRETAALLLACGMDPARAILFVQSQVSAPGDLA